MSSKCPQPTAILRPIKHGLILQKGVEMFILHRDSTQNTDSHWFCVNLSVSVSVSVSVSMSGSINHH